MRAFWIAVVLSVVLSTPVLAITYDELNRQPYSQVEVSVPVGSTPYMELPVVEYADEKETSFGVSVDAPVIKMPADKKAPGFRERTVRKLRKFCAKWLPVVNFAAAIGNIMTAVKVLTL